jgi:hypothetical protein
MQYINVASVRSIESINFARKTKLWVGKSFSFFFSTQKLPAQKPTPAQQRQAKAAAFGVKISRKIACIIIKIVSTLSTILFPIVFCCSIQNNIGKWQKKQNQSIATTTVSCLFRKLVGNSRKKREKKAITKNLVM